jgi:2-hydroxychromene-2-carboxylate isomerase
MTRKVEFFYDYGSPTAYLAWTQLPRICAAHGAELVYRPFVLGAVFKATGNAAPGMVPAKLKYMVGDMARWAAKWGVEMNINPFFPVNTVNLMKAAAGVALRMPERLEAFNTACYRAMWIEGLNMADPEVIAGALAKAGFDPKAIFALVEDEEAKAALRAATEEAVKRGAFGAPTMFVGDKMFFGQDRLEMLEAELAA